MFNQTPLKNAERRVPISMAESLVMPLVLLGFALVPVLEAVLLWVDDAAGASPVFVPTGVAAGRASCLVLARASQALRLGRSWPTGDPMLAIIA